MVHSSPEAVEEVAVSDTYSPDDHFEQKLSSDSYESEFQEMVDNTNEDKEEPTWATSLKRETAKISVKESHGVPRCSKKLSG
ncbi:hypothetical protein BTVI_125999 [Pitangus sulphuratus]|nr:hypothetical protein BTVI_125999 [Pitangus sulphuratus]